MNQFSAGFPRGMLMLPWGPDRWDAGQNPKDHTTMSQETMLGGNGNMHGEEDESSHHFDGIVSSLDSSPCQSGYRWCGENHHCPIAMVTRQVRTRRDKQLFQYNSEFSPSHGVESKNSKNNPSSNHPPRDEILGGFLLGPAYHGLPHPQPIPITTFPSVQPLGSHQQIFQEIRLTIFQPILVGQPEN